MGKGIIYAKAFVFLNEDKICDLRKERNKGGFILEINTSLQFDLRKERNKGRGGFIARSAYYVPVPVNWKCPSVRPSVRSSVRSRFM